jgi:hypothetical protein
MPQSPEFQCFIHYAFHSAFNQSRMSVNRAMSRYSSENFKSFFLKTSWLRIACHQTSDYKVLEGTVPPGCGVFALQYYFVFSNSN